VANARAAWPFTDETADSYLREQYEQELMDEAERAGLRLYRHDERLVAFPSVVRILPSDRAVRIDRKRVPGIRPSTLVSRLKANQSKKPRFASERFLETLFRAYRLLVGKNGTGTTVTLVSIYEALTLLPGSNSEYDQSDFGRDLFFLDRSGLTETRSGVRFTLPASTGTRSSRGTFSFVSPEGETVNFYGIRFTESD